MVGMRGKISKNEFVVSKMDNDGKTLVKNTTTNETLFLSETETLIFNSCAGQEVGDLYCQIKEHFTCDAEIIQDFISTIEKFILKEICTYE